MTKNRLTFSIAHLIWLTTVSALATAVLLPYVSAYGTRAVAESVSGGLFLVFHATFLLALAYGAISSKLSLSFSIPAFAVEILGILLIFGRYGVVGFLVSMTMLMLLALLAGALSDWVSRGVEKRSN